MPCFRGVDLSILTHPGSGSLPEFPHPDASSIRIVPVVDTPTSSRDSSSTSSSACLRKANPKISVYIPSLPGVQFSIQYSIQRTPEPPCQLYFKLFMNGRIIVSWGTDPSTEPSGSITRALYEPSSRWHREDGGQLIKCSGIESRYFHFAPTLGPRSAAEDGGLIEVQVFRSKGRRRRAPSLAQHRTQEIYGIMSPSSGLLDCPEEASFYDWALIDPVDSPFAVFRFHYRSWHHLHQLNLVSTEEDRLDELHTINTQEQSTTAERLTKETSTNVTLVSEKGYEFNGKLVNSDAQSSTSQVVISSGSPSEVHGNMHNYSEEQFPLASRPLPDLPVASPIQKMSIDSSAPSIAASLLEYIEDSSSEHEDVVLGTVAQVALSDVGAFGEGRRGNIAH